MKKNIVIIILFIIYSCKEETINNNIKEEMEQYNGIVLPKEWPPKYGTPKKAQNMPVPYLETPPKIIPITVGRQLFIDNFLIDENLLKRTFHYPKFYKNNPVLKPDKPWEKTIIGAPYASPFSDGIWYDEKEQKFKMWYLAGGGNLYKNRQRFVTCYAESDDGIHWKKPNYDIVPNTNVVENSWRDANTIWLDKLEKDPSKRYKLFNVQFFEKDDKWRFVLKYSRDGINWSKGVSQSGELYDRSTAFYNPFRNIWVLSTRAGSPYGRARAYLEHKNPEKAVSLANKIIRGHEEEYNRYGVGSTNATDKITDDTLNKHNIFWFGAWENEIRNPNFPEIQPSIYNHDAIAYESIMLGFFNVWQGPENDICRTLGIQKRNELCIGYSRDGFHWDRPNMDRFMGIDDTKGAWNNGNIQSINGVPLIVGDSLYFYCSGRQTNKIMWDSYTSTGLAKLRRDGFASLDASEKEGYVITKKISFDGNYLFVNADALEGDLLVELLDEKGQVLKGYSKEECTPIYANGTKINIEWKENKSLKKWDKPIKIKFYLTNASLYSFWISKYKTGESGGYTAGGGPGLHPSGIDVPTK